MTPNMATTLSPFLVSLVILLPLSLLVQCVSSGPNGFSIKLIHRDSIDSPLYPGNLSIEERLSRIHRQTEAGMERMALARAAAKGQTVHPDFLQPPVITDGYYYLALVGIGNFDSNPPYRSYYLMVDTGSSLTWTQCDECDPCYEQSEPLYPNMDSDTYLQVYCDGDGDDDCFYTDDTCVEGFCMYNFTYTGGSIATGNYAADTFTFLSDNGATETIEKFLFGCGKNQTNFNFSPDNPEKNQIAGLLGMGTGSLSLLTQLRDRAHGRFSFCLQQHNVGGNIQAASTFLRFGDAAGFKPGQRPIVTPLFNYDEHLHLHLLDISVGDVRLNFPPGTFEYNQAENEGGLVVDVGTPVTVMQEKEYKVVKGELQRWYSQFTEVEETKVEHFDLCYNAGLDFDNFQHMTLHLENADFKLVSSELYIMTNEFFCLGIIPAQPGIDVASFLLGNFMLPNRNIVFDLQRQEMAFAREDCGMGS